VCIKFLIGVSGRGRRQLAHRPIGHAAPRHRPLPRDPHRAGHRGGPAQTPVPGGGALGVRAGSPRVAVAAPRGRPPALPPPGFPGQGGLPCDGAPCRKSQECGAEVVPVVTYNKEKWVTSHKQHHPHRPRHRHTRQTQSSRCPISVFCANHDRKGHSCEWRFLIASLVDLFTTPQL
jgi:hypothetical protein